MNSKDSARMSSLAESISSSQSFTTHLGVGRSARHVRADTANMA